MTKALENTLNLPSLKDILEEALKLNSTVEVEEDTVEEAVSTEVVPVDTGIMLDQADHSRAMDALYKETLEHAQNIMDLGFNVPPGMSARLFEQGSSMYKNVVDVANSKRDFQLKTLKFMLDQRKLQLEEQKFRVKQNEDEPTTIEAEMTLVDNRNEVVKRMIEQAKADKETEK